jgi:hypothetical protein
MKDGLLSPEWYGIGTGANSAFKASMGILTFRVYKKFLSRLVFAWLAFVATQVSSAQTVYTTALSPNPLEDLGHSPCASAMGNAFTAAENDAACLFYNPAGLYRLPETQISFIHQSWIANINQDTLLAGFPLGPFGAFAVGANYLSYGTLDGYDSNGNYTSPQNPYRGSLSFGWGGPVANALSLGLAARVFSQSYAAGTTGFSSSLQTGILWRFPSRLRVGVTYGFLHTDSSPQLGVLTVGASGSFPLLSKDPLLILADYTLPLYAVSKIQMGVEQSLLNLLRARLGYQWEIDDNQITGFRGFTAGLGIGDENFDLDYSYAPDGDLGGSQMIGLTYHFPAVKAAAHPASPPPLLPPSAPPPPSAPLLPSAPPANTSVHFTPPAEVSPSDRAVTVQTLFHIPDSDQAPVSALSSPELQKSLDAAGQRVEQNPKDFQAWVDLGNLYWQAGQADYTVQCFREALRLEPGNGPLKAWLDHYLMIHPGRE